MALVRDHALRRREGLPSNPLSAMQPPPGPPSVEKCGVRGCPVKWESSGVLADPQAMQNTHDLHMLVDHPRHRATPDARSRYNENRYRVYG